MVAETFIKNIVTACMFKIVEGKVEVSDLMISNLLGATTHQIAVVRKIVEDMLVNHSMVKRPTLLHEVTSWTKEEPTTMPRVWPAFVANLPCNCQHCDVNPTNTQCPLSPCEGGRGGCACPLCRSKEGCSGKVMQ